jgi:pilus assembly protein CpaC
MKSNTLVVSLISWLGVLCTPVGSMVAQAEESMPASTRELTVPLFKSRVVSLGAPAARISVGNPDVADIVVISPTELYVLGKDLGTTNVLLWGKDNKLIGSIAVEVQHDLEGLKRKLYELLPNEGIQVRSAQRSIILSGRVSDAASLSAAMQMARSYLAQVQTAKKTEQFEQGSASHREDKSVGEVINLMEVSGAQQVMLEVKVAEIARSELKRLNARFNSFRQGGDLNWGGVNGGASFPDAHFKPDDVRIPIFDSPAPYGPVIDEFAPTDMTIANQGLFASFLNKNFLFNLAIDAAKEKGLAKILAEPTITTLTGQEAQFLSGGEFPIPVPNGNNGTTIEFKEFGVGVRFIPVVLASGHINLKLNISVSELADSNNILLRTQGVTTSFLVPSLSKRSASGTVELGDGQTIGLAGLINENLRQVVTKFPGLGSVPVLGALFRSQEYLKGETELVILVTPRLAKPLSAGAIKLPTDYYAEPSDADFYLRGAIESRKSKAERDFGKAKNGTLADQVYEPKTVENPSSAPVEGADPVVVDSAVDEMRKDHPKRQDVKRDIVINVGGQQAR